VKTIKPAPRHRMARRPLTDSVVEGMNVSGAARPIAFASAAGVALTAIAAGVANAAPATPQSEPQSADLNTTTVAVDDVLRQTGQQMIDETLMVAVGIFHRHQRKEGRVFVQTVFCHRQRRETQRYRTFQRHDDIMPVRIFAEPDLFAFLGAYKREVV